MSSGTRLCSTIFSETRRWFSGPHFDRHTNLIAANSMTIPNFSLARALRAGQTVFSGWCSLPYPIVAEIIGREGFTAVTLEAQHGLWDVNGLLTGVAAVRQSGAAPVVRVPVADFALVSRALDFGAEGIIAPMINTAADARAFAAAAKYPPVGERSWGPHRVTSLVGLADQSVYLREANDNVITLAMIETRTALGNLDAIVGTPGIDGLFLGPSDLSIALSDGKSLDPLSVEVERELDRIVAACGKAGKVPGAFCHTAERAAALAKRGVRFLAVMSDLAMLRAGVGAALKVLKSS
jgi:4-hydroxy-2-oxoheptanedioate aldolase